MWTRVADLGVPEQGGLLQVSAGARTLVLANHDGRLYALDDRCPHAGASLSAGNIDEGLLVCGWHGRAFDLTTGVCDGYQGLRAYPVEVRSDGIYVSVTEQAMAPDLRAGTT